jgi:hypothetical protein
VVATSSTTIAVFTELAMKQIWCALWCISSRSATVVGDLRMQGDLAHPHLAVLALLHHAHR